MRVETRVMVLTGVMLFKASKLTTFLQQAAAAVFGALVDSCASADQRTNDDLHRAASAGAFDL